MAKGSHHLSLHEFCVLRNCFSCSVAFFCVLSFVLVLVFAFSSNKVDVLFSIMFNHAKQQTPKAQTRPSREECDLFAGKWIYDNSTHPLYSGLQCPYMNNEIACEKYERKDLKFQQWRWQPHGCYLPRFSATKFLNKLRGKRMVFVGDSLNRNQWVSMVCMVESHITNGSKNFLREGSLLSYRTQEFNASIDFYWSPLLVESNCDNPVKHRVSNRTMRSNSIEKHARQWEDADILVFNSYLWWKKPGMKMKVLYGSFEDKDSNVEEVEMIQGFEIALKTWADWLELHSKPKTQVFFVSLSPTHLWGEEWGAESNQNCYNETEPIGKVGYTGRGSDHRMMHIVEDTLARLGHKGVHVQILNITQLSEYRKDAHPSVYRKFWDNLTEEQLANPTSYSDCTHWCLPGVPDVWNEILYTFITSRN